MVTCHNTTYIQIYIYMDMYIYIYIYIWVLAISISKLVISIQHTHIQLGYQYTSVKVFSKAYKKQVTCLKSTYLYSTKRAKDTSHKLYRAYYHLEQINTVGTAC